MGAILLIAQAVATPGTAPATPPDIELRVRAMLAFRRIVVAIDGLADPFFSALLGL